MNKILYIAYIIRTIQSHKIVKVCWGLWVCYSMVSQFSESLSLYSFFLWCTL